MPKAAKVQAKIVYPSGVKEVSDDLSTDDLVRRLKECAQAFQNISQDDDNTVYIPLALHLATDGFLQHPSRDVRLLIACCVADVFRVFAPEAPYKDPSQLKTIFEFFIQQLKGLEDPKDPTFKRYFYLLENLAWVKTFNICIELEENQAIFCKLFALMFNIVNDNHSNKVKNFMLDMMCPLISEADSVSQELLDIILIQIIEPRKSQNKNAYSLAQDILKRTSSTIEPYIQAFFNNALILGKTSRSEVAHHLYSLIYELNAICPTMLIAVLPQLEFKLKSNEEKERLEVTKLLARMFSDKDSDLAATNKPLWNCFLGRFNDISVQVRMRCVQYSMHFLINHPELKQDITEQLRQRQHDPEEHVRYEVVMAIISAAKKEFNTVSEELLNFVKERTLDKKFKIRKEALQGLAMVYKQNMSSPDLPQSTLDCISWIKNKVLHVYYQTALEDRLLVEKILHTCLVPYQLPLEERMKKLYQLFATVDDYAVKAFKELLKCQNIVRNQVRALMEEIQMMKSEERDKILVNRIVALSKNLLDPVKSQEFISKFCTLLENNQRLREHMDVILSGTASCSEAEHSVKEVMKSLGFPVQTNTFYMTIKQLLERVAPVMIDHQGVKQLIMYVQDTILGVGNIDAQLGLVNSGHRGLQLLHTLTYVFPGAFYTDEVSNELINFLTIDDEVATDITLQILINIGPEIEANHPNIATRVLPIIQNFVENGTVKQAKHAVACIKVIASNKERVFGQILDHLKQNLTLQSHYFRTSIVSIGHIAYHCPDLFGLQIKSIVSKVVVKELLMVDQDIPRVTEAMWGPFDDLPEETKVKIEGMKMMVRWLVGLKTAQQSASSTLRLLSTVVLHQGDLMEKNFVSPVEKSWMRFSAACCMLKLCHEQPYAEILSQEQFQILALVLNDECYQVREKFAQKLHKGLFSLSLPLEFMAIFALGGLEKTRELKSLFKQYLLANINKRREYLKQHPITTERLFSVLPDYVLPYAIHLLAHDPSFKKYDDIPSLMRLKDCLWFLIEPLITKNENYSFSFFKRLIENIKQTKDKQAPNDSFTNLKLYAVCDLAVGLLVSKTTSFVLKDFPVEPSLPSKLYTDPDKSYSNMKIYLPQELISEFTPPKRSGIEMEMFGPQAKQEIKKFTNGRGRKPRTANGNAHQLDSKDGGDQESNEADDSESEQKTRRSVRVVVPKEETSPGKTTNGAYVPTPPVKRGRGRPRKSETAQYESNRKPGRAVSSHDSVSSQDETSSSQGPVMNSSQEDDISETQMKGARQADRTLNEYSDKEEGFQEEPASKKPRPTSQSSDIPSKTEKYPEKGKPPNIVSRGPGRPPRNSNYSSSPQKLSSPVVQGTRQSARIAAKPKEEDEQPKQLNKSRSPPKSSSPVKLVLASPSKQQILKGNLKSPGNSSQEGTDTGSPVKRGRGRPPSSSALVKIICTSSLSASSSRGRGRGRKPRR
ncbi:sister chromatid cohesion protein PDS5 homolog A-like [Tachypleus tridentatus]|uniref:sister chromatid cohesion protein PDS5 homolog A-like n=1 Tax=Tachypleus tridentatus TaxID=6853 RepID=UPI003FD2FABC